VCGMSRLVSDAVTVLPDRLRVGGFAVVGKTRGVVEALPPSPAARPTGPVPAPLVGNLRYVGHRRAAHVPGVFGSHLANVLRRLKRIADFYGQQPQFICSSATIANPGELAQRLLEAEVEVVEGNGALRRKVLCFLQPRPW